MGSLGALLSGLLIDFGLESVVITFFLYLVAIGLLIYIVIYLVGIIYNFKDIYLDKESICDKHRNKVIVHSFVNSVHFQEKFTLTSIGFLLCLTYYIIFRYLSIFVIIPFSVFMICLGYTFYLKIRPYIKKTSKQIGKYIFCSTIAIMTIFHVIFYSYIAKSTIKFFLSNILSPLNIPLINKQINKYKINDMDVLRELGLESVITLHMIQALGMLIILLSLYFCIRVTKTTYELQLIGEKDTFGGSSGFMSSLQQGFAQIISSLRDKKNVTFQDIKTPDIRHKVANYSKIFSKKQCPECQYEGDMESKTSSPDNATLFECPQYTTQFSVTNNYERMTEKVSATASNMKKNATNAFNTLTTRFAEQESTTLDAEQNIELRQKLSDYKHILADKKCPRCQYEGYMGITKKIMPWYYSWWFIILLCFTGIGFVWIIPVIILRVFQKDALYECPKCSIELNTRENYDSTNESMDEDVNK